MRFNISKSLDSRLEKAYELPTADGYLVCYETDKLYFGDEVYYILSEDALVRDADTLCMRHEFTFALVNCFFEDIVRGEGRTFEDAIVDFIECGHFTEHDKDSWIAFHSILAEYIEVA